MTRIRAMGGASATGLGLLVTAVWLALIVGLAGPAWADGDSDPGADKVPSQATTDRGVVDRSPVRRPGVLRGPWADRSAGDETATVTRRGPERAGLNLRRSDPNKVRPAPERSGSSPLPKLRTAIDRLMSRVDSAVAAVDTSAKLLAGDAITESRSAVLPRRIAPAMTRPLGKVADAAADAVVDRFTEDVAVAGKSTVVDKETATPQVPLSVPTSLRGVLDSVGVRGAAAAVTAVVQRAESESGAATATRSLIGPNAAAIGGSMTAPRGAALINVVGSVVFNVIGAALQVFSGSPVLPAGSTVTVRSSTLTMPGSGQTVPADWYFPENVDESTRLIYLQHGFMATGPMYSYTAAYLAENTNSIVVVPSLSSNLFDPNAQWIGGSPMQQSVADLFVGERVELTESASAAAGRPVTLPTTFVLVGHSLGGSLVTGAAGRMVDNGAVDDLAGVVLLDAVDMNNAIPNGLDQLSGANYRPVLNISSERYVWNLSGLVGDELEAARPGQFNGVMLVGGRHIDALQGGNPILQFAEYLIAGFSQPQNIDAVKTISAGWINEMFEGEIPTSADSGQAEVLPLSSPYVVQATPWDPVAKVILDILFVFAVYEPVHGEPIATAV